MSMRVREATPADFPSVAQVAREVHEHHVAAVPDVFRGTEIPFPQDYFARKVADEDSDVLVAERDGALVGYAVISLRRAAHDIQVPRTIAFVDNFGTAKAARRTGVGRALFAACVAWAKAHGAGSLELDCWEAN